MTLSLPVTPRATRMALMVASVPLLTRRTRSMLGTAAMMSSAKWDSISVGAPNEVPREAAWQIASITWGWAWPRIIGPQEPM